MKNLVGLCLLLLCAICFLGGSPATVSTAPASDDAAVIAPDVLVTRCGCPCENGMCRIQQRIERQAVATPTPCAPAACGATCCGPAACSPNGWAPDGESARHRGPIRRLLTRHRHRG